MFPRCSIDVSRCLAAAASRPQPVALGVLIRLVILEDFILVAIFAHLGLQGAFKTAKTVDLGRPMGRLYGERCMDEVLHETRNDVHYLDCVNQ